MIKSFRHKGLEKFYRTGSTAGIQPAHAKRLRIQLAVIDTALKVDDINLPGFRLHKLRGDRADAWTITVNANWRLTFAFQDGNAFILNYEDYH